MKASLIIYPVWVLSPLFLSFFFPFSFEWFIMIKIASPAACETRAVITFRCPCSPSHIYTKQLLGDCCSQRQVSAIMETQRPNVCFTPRITFRPALYKITVSCHYHNKGHMPEATNTVTHSPSLFFCGCLESPQQTTPGVSWHSTNTTFWHLRGERTVWQMRSNLGDHRIM